MGCLATIPLASCSMTIPAGRNAPCHCGSGRKYKRCCQRRDIISRLACAQSERQSAFAKLLHVAQQEHADIMHDARALFWGGRLDLTTVQMRRQLEDDEQSLAAFLNWFLLDFSPDFSGETICERFLSRPATTLAPGERTYLGRMGASCLRLYEITDVRIDEGMELRDLWTDDIVHVRERLGTHQLVRWDLLAARVIEGPDGLLVFDGIPYPYPAAAKDAMLLELRDRRKRLKHEITAADDARFFKRIGMLFHHLWLDYNVLRLTPAIVTNEGDPMVFTKSAFDVVDRRRVEAVLDAHSAFDRSADEYVWLDVANDPRRILGRIVLSEGRLILETSSESRAERGRRLLEELLGGALRFRAMAQQDVDDVLADSRPRRPKPESDMPPELQQEIVGSFYERHYRDWINQPVPALGGRTPRHAARLKTVRPKVVDLIKGIENQMERARLTGQPAVDITWMWEELGLERP